MHDESLGDTRLSLGMRAYECSRTRIKEAAGDKFPWLSILTPEGRFTFAIGQTPVRFTRNDPKYLPDRKMIVSANAVAQMKLFDDQRVAGIRWFIVFDTQYKHAADTVYCVGYSETKEIICQWEIQIEDTVTLIQDLSGSINQAVELDKPSVGVKQSVKQIDIKDNER